MYSVSQECWCVFTTMKHILSDVCYEVVRFELGDDVIDELARFARGKKIHAAWISGIGSSKTVELGFYDIETKEYRNKRFGETMEILHIAGNVGKLGNELVVHLHAEFARPDYSVVGGHVHGLTANATVEMILYKMDGVLERAHDSLVGLNLLSCPVEK